MIIDLNFIPTTTVLVENEPTKVPHVIDYTLAIFIAEQLEQRVSNSNPLLEYKITNKLRETGVLEISPEERDYLQNIIILLPIDNLLKGQILSKLNQE